MKKLLLGFLLIVIMALSSACASGASDEGRAFAADSAAGNQSWSGYDMFEDAPRAAMPGSALHAMSAAAMPESAPQAFLPTTAERNVREPMLIKRATVRLNTTDFESDESFIRATVINAGGFVENSEVYVRQVRNELNLRNGHYTFRVPVNMHEHVMAIIEGVGRLVSISSSAHDASAEFHDIQGRLNVRRVEEERVLYIMSHATTVDELIQLERRLSEIRVDIEHMQRNLNTIGALAAHSTIQLFLNEVEYISDDDEEEEAAPNVFRRMANSFLLSLDVLGAVGSGALVVIAFMAIPIVVAGVVLTIVLVVVKRNRNEHSD